MIQVSTLGTSICNVEAISLYGSSSPICFAAKEARAKYLILRSIYEASRPISYTVSPQV